MLPSPPLFKTTMLEGHDTKKMATPHDFISRLILILDLMEENLFFVFSSKSTGTRFEEKFVRTKVVALEIFDQKGST